MTYLKSYNDQDIESLFNRLDDAYIEDPLSLTFTDPKEG